MSLKSIRAYLDSLVAKEFLSLDLEAEYPLLHVTPAGKAALCDSAVILANPLRNAKPRPSVAQYERQTTTPRELVDSKLRDPNAADGQTSTDEDEDDRFERLRAWRRIEAARQAVPPYVIFHDRTLRAIAQANPADEESLGTISGIGPRKIEAYGDSVLALLQGADLPPE